jgi:hypothetical protein
VEERPRPAVELQPEVLALSAHREHAPAPERVLELEGRDAVVDDGVGSRRDLGDAPAAERALGAAPRALDLGQLRHRA